MTVRMVYVTFPDRETAESIGASMVEDELAACVTFWEAGSVYRWEGTLTRDEEALAFFKTAHDREERLVEAIKEAHPYDVPCVLPLKVDGGMDAYAAWVQDMTRPEA